MYSRLSVSLRHLLIFKNIKAGKGQQTIYNYSSLIFFWHLKFNIWMYYLTLNMNVQFSISLSRSSINIVKVEVLGHLSTSLQLEYIFILLIFFCLSFSLSVSVVYFKFHMCSFLDLWIPPESPINNIPGYLPVVEYFTHTGNRNMVP